MVLIQIIGDRGSGKTLRATAIAQMESRPVYANYALRLPHYRALTPYLLYSLHDPSLVIIDEFYVWCDSRRSSTSLSTIVSWVLNQSRKRNMDIIVINQLERATDVRFREQADYNIICELKHDANGNKVFTYRWQKVSETQVWPDLLEQLTEQDARSIYPAYDTTEIIDPLNPDVLDGLIADPRELLPRVDVCCEEILLHKPKVTISQAWVRDWCLRHDQSRKLFADLLYDALKSRGL